MDWIGNANSVYKTLGASNHTEDERQIDDYYATSPEAVERLLENETFDYENGIWECACGEGHISKVLTAHGYPVVSTDLVCRGYGLPAPLDFLNHTIQGYKGDIITNPPYKYAQQFVEKAMETVQKGNKVAMILKLTFLEGKARKEMFKKYPPKTIYVFSSRINCAKNGEFSDKDSKAVAYAWFVWEKGFAGNPIVKWIN